VTVTATPATSTQTDSRQRWYQTPPSAEWRIKKRGMAGLARPEKGGHPWLGNEHGGLRRGDKGESCPSQQLQHLIQHLPVVVAMSGGVDSSVTLALLTDSAITSDLSLDISAVFMRNWSPLQNEVDHPSFETDCEWEKDWEDVRRVCRMRDVKADLVSSVSDDCSEACLNPSLMRR
jgi:hypothetical protein